MRTRSRLVGPADRPAPESKARLGLDALDDRIVPAGMDLFVEGSSASFGDGVFFKQHNAQPTGTGHINSFLRVQAAGSNGAPQQGYNTDARPLEFNENKSPNFTRGLPLSEVPKVTMGSGVYREFLLDVNQKSSSPYVSLDQLRLYMGGSGDLHGYDLVSASLNGASQVYDLDAAGGDNWLTLDYRLNTGSGSGDMLMYVPDSWFTQAGGTHVYLFSRFGDNAPAHAGFQEWAVGEGSVTAVANIAGIVYWDNDRSLSFTSGDTLLGDRQVYLGASGSESYTGEEAFQVTSADPATLGSFLFENVAVDTDYNLFTGEVMGETAHPAFATPVLGETVFVEIPIWRNAV